MIVIICRIAVGLGEGRQFVFGMYGDLAAADEDGADNGSARTGAGIGVLLAVRFATELAMLAVLAVAGAHVSVGLRGERDSRLPGRCWLPSSGAW